MAAPNPLTSVLHDPALVAAELERRRVREGSDAAVLTWVEATFGVRIPVKACCPGHVAPGAAFLDALFARSPVALWIASRGFGGKTSLLALLAAANAIFVRNGCDHPRRLRTAIGTGGRASAPPVGSGPSPARMACE